MHARAAFLALACAACADCASTVVDADEFRRDCVADDDCSLVVVGDVCALDGCRWCSVDAVRADQRDVHAARLDAIECGPELGEYVRCYCKPVEAGCVDGSCVRRDVD